MKKISSKHILMFVAIIQFIIIYSLNKNFKNIFLNFNQNIINKTFCGNSIVLNNEIIELLSVAAEQDIKLFVSEPQRIVGFLNQEELKLMDESDNTSVIKTYYEHDKIILGYFGSNFSSNQFVRHFNF
jgi:hypothetical protein